MKKRLTKQKLKGFLEEYKREFGLFKSFDVVYRYIRFLKSNSYTKILLEDVFDYSVEQNSLTLKNTSNVDFDNYVFDPKNVNKLPYFKKEQETFQKKINEKDGSFVTDDIIAPFLSCLIIVHDIMKTIKNDSPAGAFANIGKIDKSKLLEIIKSEPMESQNIKTVGEKSVSIQKGNFYGACIEIINKHVIDNIDSYEFVNTGKTTDSLSFDSEKSILYVRSHEIKIQRRSEKPNDHYVLEYIFEQGDIKDEYYFKDIAISKLGIDDYNNKKDWNTFRHACDNLNEKVDKSTAGEIKDFMKYSTGKKARCKINPQYL